MNIIHVDRLTKDFGAVRAVDDLSFGIREGTIVGFLGPNGSGKTTTLRALLGLVEPTSGTAYIDGRRYRDLTDPLRRVGVMLEAAAHPARSARNHLRILAAETGMPASRVDQLLELVELTPAARRKVGGFSLGMRQRLGLAGALMGDPHILVLDEPANGLDPEGIRWLRDFLRGLAAEGRTILLSSHVLSEVAQTVDEVVVIGSGRLIAHAPLEELMADGHKGGRVRLRSPELGRLGEVLREGGMTTITNGDGLLTVTGASQEAIGQLAFDNRIVLYEIAGEGSSLEDVFLHLTTPAEEVAP
jgi:ABC-2 type transport system ATP-binding protein